MLGPLVYGSLFGAGLLRVTPWGRPLLSFVLAGVAVAVMARTRTAALPAAALVGLLLFAAAQQWFDGLSWTRPTHWLVLLLAPAAALVACEVLRFARAWHLGAALVLVVTVLFLVQAQTYLPVMDRYMRAEPRAETYSFDPVFFSRVFYLVEKHHLGYYEAYGKASREDARFTEPITNLAGWRTPVLTRLWTTLFDSMHQITVGYIWAAAASLVLGFLLAARLSDVGTALVVPALLFPYYLAALDTYHFLSYEMWAGFFAMAAATLFAYGLRIPALPFALGAAAIREWFVSALLAGIAALGQRRRWVAAGAWVVGLLAVLGYYAFNLWRAKQYLATQHVTPSSGTQGRLLQGGPLFVLYTLQFNARFYAHVYVVPYAVFFLGLVGAAALIRRRELYVPIALLVPTVFFLLTGSGAKPGDPYGEDIYYAGAFLPFAMVAACCAGQVFRRKTEPPSAAEGRRQPDLSTTASALLAAIGTQMVMFGATAPRLSPGSRLSAGDPLVSRERGCSRHR